jgi:hypothetical protein
MPQQPVQPGSFGQAGKQPLPITFEPTVEYPEMSTFEGEQHSEGNDFTGVQFGVSAFLDVSQFISYPTKEPNDYFFGEPCFVLLLVLAFVKFSKRIRQTFSFANSLSYSTPN